MNKIVINLALASLKRHKLRTILTMLAIAIGIASVMVMIVSRDKTSVSPDDPGVGGVPTAVSDTEAVVAYTITYNNTGSSPATNFRVRNRMPSNTTYVSGSLKLNSVSKTDVSGDDEGDFNVTTANSITVVVGTVAAGASGTIEYKVYVP